MATFDRAATVFFFHPLGRWASLNSGFKIPILMYHSIGEELNNTAHPYYWTTTSPQIFSSQMHFLEDNGYAVLPLSEAVQRLNSHVPSFGKEVVITFDDGFRDFYTHAFPILAEHGYAASVFLATDYVDNEELSFKGKKCLNWREVRELHRAGISFGSHTMSHPRLSLLDCDQQTFEVARSKEVLEEKLGARVDSFSYPYAFPEYNAKFASQFRAILQEAGYTHGVSTILGMATPDDDRFFLKRLPISSRDDLRFFQAKLEGSYDWVHTFQFASKLIKSRARRRA